MQRDFSLRAPPFTAFTLSNLNIRGAPNMQKEFLFACTTEFLFGRYFGSSSVTAHQLGFGTKPFCKEELVFARANALLAPEKVTYARHNAKHNEKCDFRNTTIEIRAVQLIGGVHRFVKYGSKCWQE